MSDDYAVRKVFERLKKAFPHVTVRILGNAVHIGTYLRMVVISEHTMYVQVIDSSSTPVEEQPTFLLKRTSVKRALPQIDTLLRFRHLYDVAAAYQLFKKNCLTLHPSFREDGVMDRIFVMYNVRHRFTYTKHVFVTLPLQYTTQSVLEAIGSFEDVLIKEVKRDARRALRTVGEKLVTETRPELLPYFACPQATIDGYTIVLEIVTKATVEWARPDAHCLGESYTGEREEFRNVYSVTKEVRV